VSLFIRDARALLFGAPAGQRHGGSGHWSGGEEAAAGGGEPRVVRTHLRVQGDRIAAIGDALTALPGEPVLEARGRVLLPGFVDAHTHALWAGDRLDEWELQRRGATYLELLAAGGGILATVRAVRAASEDDLAAALCARLARMLREGTTTVEVKSGYGLSTAAELKMLRAIAASARSFPGTVVPTALLGHALDPAEPGLVERVITETLPAVHDEFPGITVDAFCEQGAWSVDACRRLLERARALGHPVRLHADQFHRTGGLPLAIALGARSVDHLEASSPADLRALAEAGVYGVLLPATGFHTDGRYADPRPFLEAGGALVLASNCNPGSSPTSSMPFVAALGRRKLGLDLPETLSAITSTPAELLDLPDRGRIACGLRADLVLLCHEDPRQLAHQIGGNPVDAVICGGALVSPCPGEL
jgi:imidazolonepropionase